MLITITLILIVYEFFICQKMSSAITVIIYGNGKVLQTDEGVTFEGKRKLMQIKRGISFDALKRRIHDKLKLNSNQIIGSITTRFYVSNKYAALQICDDEDVEIMIDNFQQQGINIIELCVEVDVAGVSQVNIQNESVGIYGDHENIDSDEDDEDYCISESYVEDSTEDEDFEGNWSDEEDSTVHQVQPIVVGGIAQG